MSYDTINLGAASDKQDETKDTSHTTKIMSDSKNYITQSNAVNKLKHIWLHLAC